MSKSKHEEKTATIEIRGVRVDQESDGLIEVFMGHQKIRGKDLRKGEAAVELIKKGLQAEGITA